MPMSVTFIPEEDRLDLSFDGNLDLTMSEGVFRLSSNIPASLRTCIMDLTRVDRVFDSGLALLQLLCAGLRRVGATLVVLGDHPEIARCISRVVGNVLYVSPLDREARPHPRAV